MWGWNLSFHSEGGTKIKDMDSEVKKTATFVPGREKVAGNNGENYIINPLVLKVDWCVHSMMLRQPNVHQSHWSRTW
jgi:hypothetical protein